MNNRDALDTIALIVGDIFKDNEEIEEFVRRFPQVKLQFREPTILEKGFSRYVARRKINYYNIVLREILAIRDAFNKWKGIEKKGGIQYLIRVDDFLQSVSLEKFLDFHEIFKKHNIPYLLGVVPLLSFNILDPQNKRFRNLTTDEASILKDPLIEIGLHGLTHQTISTRRGRHTEFVGLSSQEVEDRIQNGIRELTKHGLESWVFIPPFNAIDVKNYEVLKRHFKIITGGPESIKTLGFKISPCYFRKVLYIPSYPPLYGTCQEVIGFIRSMSINEEIIMPITLHLPWEAENNFEDVEKLCELIRDKVISWQIFLKSGRIHLKR